MKKIFIIYFFFIVSLSGCQSDTRDAVSKLMDYDDKYVGDASAVGNILMLLEVRYSRFRLTTSCKPYGIQVFCGEQKPKEMKKVIEKSHLFHSVVIFSLIKNVDIISFCYDSGLEFCFKRNEVDHFFGTKVVSFGNDKEKWETELLNKLDSQEIVNSFYSRYQVIK